MTGGSQSCRRGSSCCAECSFILFAFRLDPLGVHGMPKYFCQDKKEQRIVGGLGDFDDDDLVCFCTSLGEVA